MAEKKITLDKALELIGHANPNKKIDGWLAIGMRVSTEKVKRGIGDGKPPLGALEGYREWFGSSELSSRISIGSATDAGRLFDRAGELKARREAGKIPQNWTNPKDLLKAMNDINKGDDPVVESNRRRCRGPHNRDKQADGRTVRKWSDGGPSSFFWEGRAFANFKQRIAKLSAEERIDAAQLFFGTTAGGARVSANPDGSITVTDRETPNSPVAHATISLTINIHEARHVASIEEKHSRKSRAA